MTQIKVKQNLYFLDLNAWFEDTLNKLKAGKLHDVDIENLIEEIEGLAGRDKRELESRLEVLLSHLLKRIYVKSENDIRGWELTIREQRNQLKKMLKQSPSLQNYLYQNFSEAWEAALAEVKEDYPQTDFPKEWEYSKDIEALFSFHFWNV
jgi:hypothetical protein